MNFFLKVKEFGELLTFKSHKKKTRLIYIHIFCLAFLIIYDIIDCLFNKVSIYQTYAYQFAITV